MGYNSTATTYDSYAVCKSEEKKQNPMAHLNWCRKAYDTTIPEINPIIAARSPFSTSTVKVTSTSTSQMASEKQNYNSKADNVIKGANEVIEENESTNHVSGNHSFVSDFSSSSSDLITNTMQKYVSEKSNDTMVAIGMGRNAATAGSNDHHDNEDEFTNDSSELIPFKEAAKTEENPAYAISARSDAFGESLVQNSSLSSNLGQSEDYDGAVAISRTLHQDSIVSLNDGMQNLFHLQEEAPVKHIPNDIVEKQEWENIAYSEQLASSMKDAEL
jgi:hypothetical protein